MKSGSDELITQVIAVQNVNAAQLVPVLRPLMPQAAHMAAYPAGNILILSDRASNVSRVMRIIKRIDQQGDNEVDIINLQHASASEVVRVVNTFFQQQAAAEGGGALADARHRRRPLQQRAHRRRQDRCACASRRWSRISTRRSKAAATRRCVTCSSPTPKRSPPSSRNRSAPPWPSPAGAPPAGGAAARRRGRERRPLHHHLGGAGNQRAGDHRAGQGHALADGVVDKLDIRRAQVLVEAIIVDVR